MIQSKTALVDIAVSDITLIVTRCGQVSDELANSYCHLLSDDERQRNQRFRFAADRRKDLIARALLRTQLAAQLMQPPESIVFKRGEHGKPALLSDNPLADNLQFNLSHAGDWIVLAMANKPVGVDVEFTSRNNDVLAIADRYFFGKEIDELQTFNSDEQRQRFFDYWTLKEAYMKARGEGLSLGLSNFGFSIKKNSDISIHMKPILNDSPSDWQFFCVTPHADYRLAIALNSMVKPSVRVFECIPLHSLLSFDAANQLFN